jgi:hypothetical protein
MAYPNNINNLFLKNVNAKFGFIKFCQTELLGFRTLSIIQILIN